LKCVGETSLETPNSRNMEKLHLERGFCPCKAVKMKKIRKIETIRARSTSILISWGGDYRAKEIQGGNSNHWTSTMSRKKYGSELCQPKARKGVKKEENSNPYKMRSKPNVEIEGGSRNW